MKKNLFLLLLLLGTKQTLACDCKVISKNDDYNNSFAVFVGEIKQVSGDKFVIEPQEFFKGEEFKSAISVIDDCSILPNVGEIWLLYAKKYNDDEIYVSHCGSSRSFNWPFNFNSHNFPKPIRDSDASDINILLKLNLDIALNELYTDIDNLRTKKAAEKEKLIWQSINELEHAQIKLVNQLSLFNKFNIILFVFMIALLLINIKILKKR